VFVEPLAPAVTLLVHKLIKALGLEPTESEAKQLFFGLCTDTGFFRHLDSRGSEALALASELVRQGASPKEVYGLMYGGKSLESRQLLGLMLARSQLYFDGKLAFCTEEYEETQHFGLENRDSDMLYQLLQSIDSVQAIAVLRQETLTSCAVGLRSRDAVDVSKIAGHFGGGGHKNAAGFNANGRINAIKSLVLNAFAEVFDFKKISL
jgi:phosphoesterase RecJ-like protein